MLSYFWDLMIQNLGTSILSSTTTPVPGFEEISLQQQEEGVRRMALVPRFLRRHYANIVMDVLRPGPDVAAKGVRLA
jgi:hypothetical protein